MNILDLTPLQLKRAAAIKQRIAALTDELTKLLGASGSGQRTKRRRRMSATGRRKIAAAQRARWANLRRAELAAAVSAQPAATKKRNTAAANASRSAKLKAYWVVRKARKK
jgi:hypothetical protein